MTADLKLSINKRDLNNLNNIMRKAANKNKSLYKPLKQSALIIAQNINRDMHKTTAGPLVFRETVEWPAMSEVTKKMRSKNKKKFSLLLDTGRLANSIKGEANNYQGVVGTNVNYALKQQSGFGNIPARPFLFFSKKDLETVAKVFSKFEDEVLK